jgi:putative oxidoreductase
MKNFADLAGRILLAVLFLIVGIGKLGGGALVVAGLWTCPAALALAAFTVLAALLFHANFADPMQKINFLKNLSIAGGFLLLAANGAGAWSVDARRRKEVNS